MKTMISSFWPWKSSAKATILYRNHLNDSVAKVNLIAILKLKSSHSAAKVDLIALKQSAALADFTVSMEVMLLRSASCRRGGSPDQLNRFHRSQWTLNRFQSCCFMPQSSMYPSANWSNMQTEKYLNVDFYICMCIYIYIIVFIYIMFHMYMHMFLEYILMHAYFDLQINLQTPYPIIYTYDYIYIYIYYLFVIYHLNIDMDYRCTYIDIFENVYVYIYINTV